MCPRPRRADGRSISAAFLAVTTIVATHVYRALILCFFRWPVSILMPPITGGPGHDNNYDPTELADRILKARSHC